MYIYWIGLCWYPILYFASGQMQISWTYTLHSWPVLTSSFPMWHPKTWSLQGFKYLLTLSQISCITRWQQCFDKRWWKFRDPFHIWYAKYLLAQHLHFKVCHFALSFYFFVCEWMGCKTMKLLFQQAQG